VSESVVISEPEKGCFIRTDENRRFFEAQEEGKWIREEKKNKVNGKGGRQNQKE
jgi:hypothetical protein